ncbi:neuropeptide CCHamide-1 receptor-like [Centruroides sculpturatus]|uniref:neuropeptide CCHamide-1 receptor-like n=1 Tax=Centruroides sculpturatus TaxID=218467 RepID=UPI000C6E7FFB|nr:neuropeptide CCHamide-1 receptor-like [Centruroides sculpturatus]
MDIVFNLSSINASWELPDNESLNDTDQYVPYEKRLETYVVPAVFAVVLLVGIIGNGTLIFIFVRNKSVRSIPNTYIMSLAVGDFTVIVGTVPFISTIYTFESWPYGEFLCKLSEFLKDVSVAVTVLTLTMLSVDRYIAIVLPMRKYTGRHAKTLTVLFALGIWCIALALATPGAYYSFLWEVSISPDKVIYVCYPFPHNMWPWYPQMMVLMKFLLLYAIPLTFIGSCYVLMARHLYESTRNGLGINGRQIKQLRTRAKIAKIVLSFVVIFAICFFPSQVFMMWYYFHSTSNEDYNDFWHVWKIVGYVLTFVNSCLNPIALYLNSGVFRSHFNRTLFCCCFTDHTEYTRSLRTAQSTIRTQSYCSHLTKIQSVHRIER